MKKQLITLIFLFMMIINIYSITLFNPYTNKYEKVEYLQNIEWDKISYLEREKLSQKINLDYLPVLSSFRIYGFEHLFKFDSSRVHFNNKYVNIYSPEYAIAPFYYFEYQDFKDKEVQIYLSELLKSEFPKTYAIVRNYNKIIKIYEDSNNALIKLNNTYENDDEMIKDYKKRYPKKYEDISKRNNEKKELIIKEIKKDLGFDLDKINQAMEIAAAYNFYFSNHWFGREGDLSYRNDLYDKIIPRTVLKYYFEYTDEELDLINNYEDYLFNSFPGFKYIEKEDQKEGYIFTISDFANYFNDYKKHFTNLKPNTKEEEVLYNKYFSKEAFDEYERFVEIYLVVEKEQKALREVIRHITHNSSALETILSYLIY